MVEPVYSTPRSPERVSNGHKVSWVSDQLGYPLMDWQRQVADVGKEMIPADDETIDRLRNLGQRIPAKGLMVPAYREVVVTIMRQNGKTTLMLGVENECMMQPNARVAYTAQTGLDARQKFTEDQAPILQRSPLDDLVRQYYKAADNTGMWWKNGSRLKVLNTGQGPGHGKTLDLAVLDETWHDNDESREQALRPAMITKPLAQLWNISTAGTPASTYLLRKVELGRAAVRSGRREGLAYFEWAIPDDEDIYSPDVWRRFMPAFGVTIGERELRSEAENMKEGEFRRAFGNQWTETEERIIPAEWWRSVCNPEVRTDNPLYAVDARADHGSACVVKADVSGNVELVALRNGVDWLRTEIPDKVSKQTTLVVDGYGPVAYLADDWEKAGFRVDRTDSLTARKACGRFFDAVADRKIQVRTDERLDAAVAAAARKASSDTWMWHRDAPGGDLLMAVSLAYATAVTEGEVFTPFAWS